MTFKGIPLVFDSIPGYELVIMPRAWAKERVTMQINVLQNDIDHGVVGDACKCPVARAITRHVGRQASVAGASGYFMDNGQSLYLGQSVSNFVRRFDDKQSVEPFSFELVL